MYYPFVRKALFQLDPERAHELTFQQLRRITGTPLAALVRQNVPEKPVQCMGLTFKNPLGLAAGLDKNGECIDALGAMEPKPIAPRASMHSPFLSRRAARPSGCLKVRPMHCTGFSGTF